MPNLIPPKIPDGEKVDFDVSIRLGIKTDNAYLITAYTLHGFLHKNILCNIPDYTVVHSTCYVMHLSVYPQI